MKTRNSLRLFIVSVIILFSSSPYDIIHLITQGRNVQSLFGLFFGREDMIKFGISVNKEEKELCSNISKLYDDYFEVNELTISNTYFYEPRGIRMEAIVEGSNYVLAYKHYHKDEKQMNITSILHPAVFNRKGYAVKLFNLLFDYCSKQDCHLLVSCVIGSELINLLNTYGAKEIDLDTAGIDYIIEKRLTK